MTTEAIDHLAIERLRKELSTVERKLAAHYAKSDFDPDADFALKTEIGGIRSESRRTKARRWARWDREAAEGVELERQKKAILTQIAYYEAEPERRARAEAQGQIDEILREMLRPGDLVQAGDYQAVATVTRVNAKTVSFKLPSGFTDRLPFSDIAPLAWSEMRQAWEEKHAGQGAEATMLMRRVLATFS